VPPRTLTERLRELEQAGVLERRLVDASPPYAEYRLTERGRRLAPVLQAMGAWRD
jgi:DNA-binding HxlR family transcriptional regulator